MRLLVAVVVLALLTACSPAADEGGSGGGSLGGSAAGLPPAPPGTRWLGVHGLVVAAPRGWPVETDPCLARHDPVVRLVADRRHRRVVNCPRLGPGAQPDSVLVAGPLGDPALPRLRDLPTRTTVHGVDVRTSPVVCLAGEPTTCSTSVAVPSARAAFAVTVRGRDALDVVRALRGSLRAVPDGVTTVPPLEVGTPVAAATDRLAAAGLRAPAPDVDVPHHVTGTEPVAGSPVPRGSTVTLRVGDG